MNISKKQKQSRLPAPESSRRTALTTYYRSNTNPAAASPFQKKEAPKSRRKYLFGFLDLILIAGLVVAIIYSLMLNPSPKVTANNLSYHSLAEYQAAAGKYLHSLRDRSKVTFDEKSLAGALQKQFPEISLVQVELPFFSEKPTIRLSIDRPSFRLSSQNVIYVVNSGGVAVTTVSKLPTAKQLPLITDQSGFLIRSGQPALSVDSVNFITSLIAQCQRASVPISSLTLPPLAQELDLRTSDQPYYVKFYLGGDVLNEAGQFLAARQKFTQTHQTPAQYLDVRIAGKVFYK